MFAKDTKKRERKKEKRKRKRKKETAVDCCLWQYTGRGDLMWGPFSERTCDCSIARPWPTWPTRAEIFFDIKPNVTSSFHASQFAVNLTQKMLEDAGSNEGLSVLSASQEIEDFALEYAEQHLNDSKPVTITKEKLGKLLWIWLSHFHYTFYSSGRLENHSV